jgi:hypothetical protein
MLDYQLESWEYVCTVEIFKAWDRFETEELNCTPQNRVVSWALENTAVDIRVRKRRNISWPAEWLSASWEELSSIKLV